MEGPWFSYYSPGFTQLTSVLSFLCLQVPNVIFLWRLWTPTPGPVSLGREHVSHKVDVAIGSQHREARKHRFWVPYSNLSPKHGPHITVSFTVWSQVPRVGLATQSRIYHLLILDSIPLLLWPKMVGFILDSYYSSQPFLSYITSILYISQSVCWLKCQALSQEFSFVTSDLLFQLAKIFCILIVLPIRGELCQCYFWLLAIFCFV